MGSFSRRPKARAGEEYIKRLRFLSTCVETCGAQPSHHSPLYIAYSTSTYFLSSFSMSNILLSSLIGRYPAELLKRLLIFRYNIYFSLLHLKDYCIQYPTSNYLRLLLCRLCSYSYNTTPFISVWVVLLIE